MKKKFDFQELLYSSEKFNWNGMLFASNVKIIKHKNKLKIKKS